MSWLNQSYETQWTTFSSIPMHSTSALQQRKQKLQLGLRSWHIQSQEGHNNTHSIIPITDSSFHSISISMICFDVIMLDYFIALLQCTSQQTYNARQYYQPANILFKVFSCVLEAYLGLRNCLLFLFDFESIL